MIKLIEKLFNERTLSLEEYEYLIANRTPEYADRLALLAQQRANEVYGNKIFVRGLIEISNICKNDCLYCGIRRSNKKCSRYRLTKEEILECAKKGYETGCRTFVMQGGEDGFYSDKYMAEIISELKKLYPDCAVTLSLGEKSFSSYKLLFDEIKKARQIFMFPAVFFADSYTAENFWQNYCNFRKNVV